MRTQLLLAIVLASAAEPIFNSGVHLKWTKFKEKFKKGYNGPKHESVAFKIFEENDKRIEMHNAKNLSWIMGHNEFSDLTDEQFKNQYIGGLAGVPPANASKVDPALRNFKVEAGASIDWSSRGVLTDVKSQGTCGGCWAFSTTGAIEAAYRIAGHPLTSFSEQALISCESNNLACKGGWLENSFDYVSQHGLCAESEYPYESFYGNVGSCRSCTPIVTSDGYQTAIGEAELVAAISKTPTSVLVEADLAAWRFYSGGVLADPACGQGVDHAVLAVGYGTESGTDYYKVKNSWGTSWGEGGYIRLKRNVRQCGIGSVSYYPVGVRPTGSNPTPRPTPYSPTCQDDDTSGSCPYWAQAGYCTDATYGPYMQGQCKASCGLCGGDATPTPQPPSSTCDVCRGGVCCAQGQFCPDGSVCCACSTPNACQCPGYGFLGKVE